MGMELWSWAWRWGWSWGWASAREGEHRECGRGDLGLAGPALGGVTTDRTAIPGPPRAVLTGRRIGRPVAASHPGKGRAGVPPHAHHAPLAGARHGYRGPLVRDHGSLLDIPHRQRRGAGGVQDRPS
eukprot:gene12838-biopygen5231